MESIPFRAVNFSYSCLILFNTAARVRNYISLPKTALAAQFKYPIPRIVCRMQSEAEGLICSGTVPKTSATTELINISNCIAPL